MKLPARPPCHESREWVVLDLIALRKHVLQRSFLSCEKKESISNLHVIGPLNEPNYNLNFFLYHAVLPSQTCRIPDETKKILGPKVNAPNFQALKFFREGSNDMAR